MDYVEDILKAKPAEIRDIFIEQIKKLTLKGKV